MQKIVVGDGDASVIICAINGGKILFLNGKVQSSFINMASSLPQDSFAAQRFVLEIIGFSDAETNLLTSTFRLTGRRPFHYAEAAGPQERADIYLVNADNPQALWQLKARAPSVHVPAVLIGRQQEAPPWPLVTKPIQWMRLFEQLDLQMRMALNERARRRNPGGMEWRGGISRRACDRDAPHRPLFEAPGPQESVLVVDDSATVRAFMRSRLAPFRFDVDYAESGEKAIDMAQAKLYTCIFLDILMPGMDGYRVCKRIKSSSATRDAAVVVLSSRASALDKFRGSWAGCDAYLGKPVAEDELLATIARFLPSARDTAQALMAKVS